MMSLLNLKLVELMWWLIVCHDLNLMINLVAYARIAATCYFDISVCVCNIIVVVMHTYIVCFDVCVCYVEMWHSYTEMMLLMALMLDKLTMNMEFCVRRPACETYWFMPHHK